MRTALVFRLKPPLWSLLSSLFFQTEHLHCVRESSSASAVLCSGPCCSPTAFPPMLLTLGPGLTALQWGCDHSQLFPGLLPVPPLLCSKTHTGSQQPSHSCGLCQALTVVWVNPAPASPQQQLCASDDRALLRKGQRGKKNLVGCTWASLGSDHLPPFPCPGVNIPPGILEGCNNCLDNTPLPNTQSSSGKPKLQIHVT